MNKKETRLLGRGVSPGQALGPALFVAYSDHDVFRFPLEASAIEAEIERLGRAVDKTRTELRRMHRLASAGAGMEVARVFEAHELMLTDQMFLGRVEAYVRSKQVNAEWAVEEVGAELLAQFRAFESDHLRARGQDLMDVVQALSKALEGIDHHQFQEIGDSVVVIARELSPSEVIRLHERGIGGIVLQEGGHNSHTAIVAKALQIPLVIGVENAQQEDFDRTPVLIDGGTGEVVLHPSPETLAGVSVRSVEAEPDRPLQCGDSYTRDGTLITLRANIEFEVELGLVVRTGAAGVGLYRSEFLYIEKAPDLPTEQEHFETFKNILEATGSRGAVIRTFDLGGRQLSRVMLQLQEDNPSLGLRGIRLTLQRRDLFRTQLRGLIKAAPFGELRIMIPLVSNLEEVREFRALLQEVEAEVAAEGSPLTKAVPLGAMVEVPAAALIANELAAELDFLAIGTNDLTQYTLAVDRNNEHVAALYQPLHPAILRLIDMTVRAGAAHGTEISLCGEMASDTKVLPLLVGLGLRVLSASPRCLASLADAVADLDTKECRVLALRALACGSARDVASLLETGRSPS